MCACDKLNLEGPLKQNLTWALSCRWSAPPVTNQALGWYREALESSFAYVPSGGYFIGAGIPGMFQERCSFNFAPDGWIWKNKFGDAIETLKTMRNIWEVSSRI